MRYGYVVVGTLAHSNPENTLSRRRSSSGMRPRDAILNLSHDATFRPGLINLRATIVPNSIGRAMEFKVMKIISSKWIRILAPVADHSYRLLNSMDRIDGVQCPAMNRSPSRAGDFSSVINCTAESSRLSARAFPLSDPRKRYKSQTIFPCSGEYVRARRRTRY